MVEQDFGLFYRSRRFELIDFMLQTKTKQIFLLKSHKIGQYLDCCSFKIKKIHGIYQRLIEYVEAFSLCPDINRDCRFDPN